MEDDNNDKKSFQGQAEIWKYIFSFVDSMALKCAVELKIADIINSHGAPITLVQMAAGISGASSPDISSLARIMRLLVRRKVFAVHHPSDGSGEETLYGLTHSSRWLLRDTSELSMAPMVLMQTHPWLMDPWHCLGHCIKHGGVAFERAHGKEIWDFALEKSEFNKLFNDAMESTARIEVKTILAEYGDGFRGLRSLVDVGGGTGRAVAEIVKSQPHIEGINFDLPHVLATAPVYSGVKHVGGDMFESVPNADAVFMKMILHDWGDEECVQILKNCRKAILNKNGKVIIVDVVLEAQENINTNGFFEETALMFDLVVAHACGGKERTEIEWKKLLNKAGFPRYKFIKIQTVQSIIEAYAG